jgi:hypothetical protein
MREIHCHRCGGFIADAGTIAYVLPCEAAVAAPRSDLCDCSPAVVYGPPPGYLTSPGLASVARSKAAATN